MTRPDSLRDAIRGAASCLSGARLILEKTYPEGDAPPALLPALILATAILWRNPIMKEAENDE